MTVFTLMPTVKDAAVLPGNQPFFKCISAWITLYAEILIRNHSSGRFQLWPNSIGINLGCGFELGVETEYML